MCGASFSEIGRDTAELQAENCQELEKITILRQFWHFLAHYSAPHWPIWLKF